MASYTKFCLFVLFLYCSFVAVLSDSLTDLIREHILENDKSCGNGMSCVQPELCDENRSENVITNFRSNSRRNVDCEANEKCCFVKENVPPKVPLSDDKSFNRDICGGNGMVCVEKNLCIGGIVDKSASKFIQPFFGKVACKTGDVCCLLSSEVTSTETPEPTVQKCGQSNPEGLGSGSTVEGKSKYGEFPWVVQVLENTFSMQTLCAGSLVSPNVIVTVAHSVVKASENNLWVRAGEWDTQTTTEQYPHLDRKVLQRIIHPKFKEAGLFFDIAILKLESNYLLSSFIRTICLPTANMNLDNTRCIVAGWGKSHINDAEYSRILKKIEVPVVDRETCQNELRTTSFGRYFELNESFICAGGERDNVCIGDAGAPLMCPIKGSPNHYQLAGTVAFGVTCNAWKVPTVYVNVTMVQSWIESYIN